MKKAIVLAAGEGTRMKSTMPKVLHKVLGLPMLEHVIRELKALEIEEIIVIIGHGKDHILEAFKDSDIKFVEQPIGDGAPYGTGYAVMQAIHKINPEDEVLVVCGDTPLIKSESLNDLMEKNKQSGTKASVMTTVIENNFGYGRIVKDGEGNVMGIVEEKDADFETKKIKEINSGIYVFEGNALIENLKYLDSNNSQGELYLTDVIKILNDKGEKVSAVIIEDDTEILGVNSRVQLSECEAILRKRVNTFWMNEGVTIVNPDTVIIEPDVKIGRGTIIYPNVRLMGSTTIGERCSLEGDTRILDSTVGDECIILSSYIEESILKDRVSVGPFAHFRPNTVVYEGAHIGNFVELKNTNFGVKSKAGHLAYVGDADVGDDVNIGCGVITVNYNGKEKFRTVIEDGAFIGSNSNLVAPIKIEKNAYVACGSSITKDVESEALAIERAEQKIITGWVRRKNLIK